ncbi:MAG: diphosphomevalonate decarboxylase [Planctomycetes bacterium]|nr:diphosphomevalonate decarboxylase [Planctomycetota bacterium]
MKATAVAHPNLAFVKYWGKRDEALRLPAEGSISMTLSGLSVRTTVEFQEGTGKDDVIRIGGEDARGEERERVVSFLDIARGLAGTDLPARVESLADFPRSAGLASSAAAFAALALAASRAAGLELRDRDLAALARQGSGSATRSIHGGFVEWRRGARADGADCHGVQLTPPEAWPELRLLASVVEKVPKPCSSTEGMRRTAATSPFYSEWLALVKRDLDRARRAIRERDLALLGETAESNALAMHAVCLAAWPPILYWSPGTIDVVRRIQALRADGVPVYLSIDAGPNVFAITDSLHEGRIRGALEELRAVESVHASAPGPGARLVEDHVF